MMLPLIFCIIFGFVTFGTAQFENCQSTLEPVVNTLLDNGVQIIKDFAANTTFNIYDLKDTVAKNAFHVAGWKLSPERQIELGLGLLGLLVNPAQVDQLEYKALNCINQLVEPTPEINKNGLEELKQCF